MKGIRVFRSVLSRKKKRDYTIVDLSKRTEQHVNWENIKTTGYYMYEHKY